MKKKFFVKKNYEFQKILKQNNNYFFKNFILFVDKNNYKHTRIGISVGKRNYKLAVTRNKIKRQVRHIVHTYSKENETFLKLAVDIIILVKIKNYENKKFTEIKESLYEALKLIENKIERVT